MRQKSCWRPNANGFSKRTAITGIAAALVLFAGIEISTLYGQTSNGTGRFLTDGRMNGLLWIAMNSEEKSSCLMGFESGIQTAAEYAGVNAGDPKVEDEINTTLLVRNAPGFSVVQAIDRVYKDKANLLLNISVAYSAAKFRAMGMREEGVQTYLKTMRQPDK
jgi:hypothetical protein